MWTEASRGLINPFPPVPILLSWKKVLWNYNLAKQWAKIV
jgi:hypothetical protein